MRSIKLSLLFCLAFIFSITINAVEPTLKERFATFEKDYENLFKLTSNKTEFLKLEQSMQNQYDAYNKAEGLNFTSDGTTMVYILEVLNPLKELIEKGITPKECELSLFKHSMNSPSNDDSNEYLDKVKNTIVEICKPK